MMLMTIYRKIEIADTKFLTKGLVVAGLAFVVFSINTTNVKAQDNLLFFGQKQAYTVIVRPDKKAITYGKIYLNNGGGNYIDKTSFTVPEGVEVSNMSIYQILLPENCTGSGYNSDIYGSSSGRGYGPTCSSLDNQVFDIGGYYYDSTYSYESTIRQEKVNFSQDGQTYNLTLPEPIEPGRRGAYVVSYIANKGYVTDSFGLFTLNFETLKVKQNIEEVRASVYLPNNFYSESSTSKISNNASNLSNLETSLSSGASVNKSLGELQNNIGKGGQFSETGKGLLANETLVVSGQFADAIWKLKRNVIFAAVVILVSLIPVVIFLLKKANGSVEAPQKEGHRKWTKNSKKNK